MTEGKWINFDNVEKIVALEDVLKVFYDGHDNKGVSFEVEDKIEAIKIATEISYAVTLGEVLELGLDDITKKDRGALIEDGKLGESYRDDIDASELETMYEGKYDGE